MNYCEIIKDGVTMRGMVHQKDNANCKGVILIVHGYLSANKIGLNRFFVLLAESLSQLDYQVYRFDLPGMGESDLLAKDITFDIHTEYINHIIQTIKIDSVDTFVISHCIGCSLTVQNMLLYDNMSQNILLAPFINTPAILAKFFDNNQLADINQNGFTKRKGLYVSGSFFLQFNYYDKKIINQLSTKNIVIIAADQDEYVDSQEIKKLSKALNKQVHWIDNEVHNFYMQMDKTIDTIIQSIRSK